MKIIAVDDEPLALRTLERAIRSAAGHSAVESFTSAEEALAFAAETAVDVAFLDIEMEDMPGLLLAKRLKELHPSINIIFVTGYSEYAGSAFELHASGYVMKPIEASQVALELENLRTPAARLEDGLRVQCFGNFEVFHHGRPVYFRFSKSKEIFAYLIDRNGATATKKELAAILWEDAEYTRSRQKKLQALLAEMIAALEALGVGHLIIKHRGAYAVDVSGVNCDYYNYQKGDAAAVNSYRGEYMANYSWGEFTAGHLSRESVPLSKEFITDRDDQGSALSVSK